MPEKDNDRQHTLPLETPAQPATQRRPRRAYEPLLDQMKSFGLKPVANPEEHWRRSTTWPWLWASTHGRIATEGQRYTHPPYICRSDSKTGAGGYAHIEAGKRGTTPLFLRRAVVVADTWHGPRPAGMVLRHIDGTRRNDTPDNLAWGTKSANALDKHSHGTMQATLTRAAVIGLLLALRHNESDQAAAARLMRCGYWVSPTTITKIRTGRSWRHVAPCLPRRRGFSGEGHHATQRRQTP